MPVLSSAVGQVFGDRTIEVTSRMTMAYAAAIGATEDIFLDDAREGGVVAPPPFSACLEWPLLFDPKCRKLTGTSDDEAWGGLHVQQDTRFHRVIRPGDRLRTVGRITQIRTTRAGALAVAKMLTNDAGNGEAVTSSWIHILFKGLYVDGGDRAVDNSPALKSEEPDADATQRASLHLPRTLPHAYTECSGIWNPIHTERSIARRKGLPDIIVHGTCTWAVAALHALRQADAGPERLKRFAGRFEAMVIPGTDVVLESARLPGDDEAMQLQVRNAEGNLALADGIAEFRPQPGGTPG